MEFRGSPLEIKHSCPQERDGLGWGADRQIGVWSVGELLPKSSILARKSGRGEYGVGGGEEREFGRGRYLKIKHSCPQEWDGLRWGGGTPSFMLRGVPLPSEYGTYKSVEAMSWP